MIQSLVSSLLSLILKIKTNKNKVVFIKVFSFSIYPKKIELKVYYLKMTLVQRNKSLQFILTFKKTKTLIKV